MSFKMVWKSTGEPVTYDDPAKHFRFNGTPATCQLEAQVDVPSIGFSWKSDPLDTSKADVAVLGDEVNGRYYESLGASLSRLPPKPSLGPPSWLRPSR